MARLLARVALDLLDVFFFVSVVAVLISRVMLLDFASLSVRFSLTAAPPHVAAKLSDVCAAGPVEIFLLTILSLAVGTNLFANIDHLA